jgi:hypothetical protein
MEPIVNKYLDFSSRDMPENRFNSIYIEKYVNLFNAIRQNIKNGNLTDVIKGKGQFSTFKYTHPGSFAMPHENTNISSLFSIFYILIDNGDLKKEAITNSLIELSEKEDYLYIYSYLSHYIEDSWINTENDIVLDWRVLVEYINKEYLNKGIEIIDDKFFYNNFMKFFNEKNFGVKFMI